MVIEQQNNRNKEKKKDLIYLAWHVEALHRCKKLPKFEELIKEKEDKKVMTEEQMLRQVKFLNAMFGGEIKEKEV